jgi:hypothetical protein
VIGSSYLQSVSTCETYQGNCDKVELKRQLCCVQESADLENDKDTDEDCTTYKEREMVTFIPRDASKLTLLIGRIASGMMESR